MKTEKSILIFVLALLSLFSIFFTYFNIDPVLHYHHQQIAWHSGHLFFEHFLTYPGGIAEYLTLFVSQWFSVKWVGSIIIGMSGFIISLNLYQVIKLRWQSKNLFIFLLPLIQITNLVLFFDYRYHFSVTFNLLLISIALLFVSLFDRRWNLKGTIIALLVGAIIYIVSGGMYFLLFMISAVVLLLKTPLKESVWKVSLVLLAGALIPYLGYKYFFLVSLKYSFLKSVPNVAVMLRYSEPYLFQIALAIIPAILVIEKITTLFPLSKKDAEKKKSNSYKTRQVVLITVQLVLVIIISSIVIIREYKPVEKTRVEIDYYAHQQNWEKVIALSNKLEDYDRMVNFHFNRALLNTGQVMDRIFEYPQKLGTLGLFLDVPFTAEITLPNSDLYFDLGNIDESLRYAFESETLMKNSPRVLKRLILNCIILDKMEAAITYLNILESNPIQKKWAQKYRKLANNRQLAAEDDLIRLKRNQLSKAEGMKITPPLKLLQQLEKNPKNKKAVEYLIACDLMEHDLSSLEEDFKYLKQFNLLKLPVSIEEAIILFRSQNKNNEFLNSFRISEETVTRFREFAKLSKASGGDREKAKSATEKFEKTYWYYVLFLSPRVTNLKLETTPVDTNY